MICCRINSLKEENCNLRTRFENEQKQLEEKKSSLEDANSRLLDLERQLKTENIEHTVYKEKAKRVLQVSAKQ